MHLMILFARLFSWALVVTLMTGSVGVAHAQSTEPSQPDDQNVVAFERLGTTDQTLSGVFDGTRYLFNIPANWQLGNQGRRRNSICQFSFRREVHSDSWGDFWKRASIGC
jgi:hypothetical protein